MGTQVSDEAKRRARLDRLLSEDPVAARSRAVAEADRRIAGRGIVLHGCGQMGRKLARVLAQDCLLYTSDAADE